MKYEFCWILTILTWHFTKWIWIWYGWIPICGNHLTYHKRNIHLQHIFRSEKGKKSGMKQCSDGLVSISPTTKEIRNSRTSSTCVNVCTVSILIIFSPQAAPDGQVTSSDHNQNEIKEYHHNPSISQFVSESLKHFWAITCWRSFEGKIISILTVLHPPAPFSKG